MGRRRGSPQVAGERTLTSPPLFIIDTSVAVKWFSREDFTDCALKLRDAAFAGNCRLAAQDLLLYELANALRFNPRFDASDVKLAIKSVEDMGIDFHPAQGPLLSLAVDLAFHHRITVYDGCFLALAVQEGGKLVTADTKLIPHTNNHKALLSLSELPI